MAVYIDSFVLLSIGQWVDDENGSLGKLFGRTYFDWLPPLSAEPKALDSIA